MRTKTRAILKYLAPCATAALTLVLVTGCYDSTEGSTDPADGVTQQVCGDGSSNGNGNGNGNVGDGSGNGVGNNDSCSGSSS
jgi:hypothetical protein